GGVAVAALVLAVALVISGIGIIVMALTIGARYAGSPPPNAGSLALLPAVLGLLLLLLGGGLVAGGLGVLAAARRARLVTGILSAVAAGLAALGAVLAMINAPPDPVIAVALTVATLVFGVSALLFLRPRR
ncbi:MAG: hypothetical protein KY392_04410, partial [Chloroflexi bacterium]|nr:hypothetical protein [Chloroflexota bacterium]